MRAELTKKLKDQRDYYEGSIADQKTKLDQLQVNHIQELQNLETKIKLTNEALRKRNDELKESEDNNVELIRLVDDYDNKLEELNEQNEFKDL